MSFSQSDLVARGFSEEQAKLFTDAVAVAVAEAQGAAAQSAQTATVPAGYVSQAEFNQLKARIAAQDAEIANVRKENKSLKAYTKAVEFRNAVDSKLAKMGAIEPELVRFAMDQSKITFDANGNMTGFDEEVARVRAKYGHVLFPNQPYTPQQAAAPTQPATDQFDQPIPAQPDQFGVGQQALIPQAAPPQGQLYAGGQQLDAYGRPPYAPQQAAAPAQPQVFGGAQPQFGVPQQQQRPVFGGILPAPASGSVQPVNPQANPYAEMARIFGNPASWR